MRRSLLAGIVGFPLLWHVVPRLMPWPKELNRPPPAGGGVTARDGAPLRRTLEDGRRVAEPLPLRAMPKALIQATLAAEDKRFHSHGGVDPLAILRAAKDSLLAGRAVSGASTITQQMVKLAHPTLRPRVARTKVIEALTARRVEMEWDKDRILENYLRRLDYGNLHQGPEAAALGYFAKPLTDCSLAECALLAGLPQSPGRLNPWKWPERAIARQRWILGRMLALKWITRAEYDRAIVEPLRLRRHYGQFTAPHFVDWLLRRQSDADRPPSVHRSLRSTLDVETQRVCENAVADRLSRLAANNVTQAAVVALDNATGDVLAMVGGRDYNDPQGGQVNGATARRSPGSALKPFTWLLALQRGASPAQIIPDLPVEYMTPTGVYRPQNYNRRATGPVSLRAALANSLNLSAVRLLRDNGGEEALIAALQSAGVSTLTRPAKDYGLGLTIGGGEVTLLELTNAYACLARMGEYRPVRWLADDPVPPATRVFDPDACWLLADILADNDARARAFGTASALRMLFPAAVKTGTSTDYRDNWAIGFTPRHTVGVWAGNFDNSPMRDVSGVSGAAPILRDVLTWLETRRPSGWYPRPESIVEMEVDPLTGLPVPPELTGKRPVVREKFRADLAPDVPARETVYDDAGRVLLPREYAAWLAGPDNWLGDAATPAPPETLTTSGKAGWRITSPVAGSVFYLDPDLPHQGGRLRLRVTPAVPGIAWSSPTLTISGDTALLQPGRHEVTARHPATGAEQTAWIEVRKL